MSVLLVIAGPSGVGKGTIVRRLLEREPGLWFSISATNRPRRADEVDGRDYLFISNEEFERLRDEGEFLEWFEVYGDLKGTPRRPVQEHLAAGTDVLIEVDVQGSLAIREAYPDALLVFVHPPSREVQRQRLLERDPGADAAELETRLAQAEAEESLASAFDAVIVNDDLERAVGEIAALVEAHRGVPPGA